MNVQSAKEINSVQLIDLTGKIVWQKSSLLKHEMVIDLKGINKGFYLLQISDVNGKTIAKKVQVN